MRGVRLGQRISSSTWAKGAKQAILKGRFSTYDVEWKVGDDGDFKLWFVGLYDGSTFRSFEDPDGFMNVAMLGSADVSRMFFSSGPSDLSFVLDWRDWPVELHYVGATYLEAVFENGRRDGVSREEVRRTFTDSRIVLPSPRSLKPVTVVAPGSTNKAYSEQDCRTLHGALVEWAAR